MTDSGYRHVVLVIDRSGSMGEHAVGLHGPTKADVANKGLAEFFETQRQNPLRTTASLYQFDVHHELVADFVPVDYPYLREYLLLPRGGTALLDAIGFAVTKTGEKLLAMGEDKRPCEVTVVVVTDGHENSSLEYKLPQVKEMITHQAEVYGWHFIYLGADPSAFDEGVSMGFPAGSTATLDCYTVQAYATAGQSMNTATATASPPVFTPADRRAMNSDDDDEE